MVLRIGTETVHWATYKYTNIHTHTCMAVRDREREREDVTYTKHIMKTVWD